MTSDTSPPLVIPPEIHRAMVDHCLRDDPNEACGLLGGSGGVISSIHPLRNVEASPVRYNADPSEIIRAIVWLRERGGEILAIYHSHPGHPAIPSRVDLAENHYGDVPRIIVSLTTRPPEVRVWRLRPDDFDEIPWRRGVEAGID